MANYKLEYEGDKYLVLLATMNSKIGISCLVKLKTKFQYTPKFPKTYAIYCYNALSV